MKIGPLVSSYFVRQDPAAAVPPSPATRSVTPGMAATERSEAVRVSISPDALAALAQANDATPDTMPESSNSGEITATVVPQHDPDAVFASWRARLARGQDLSDVAHSLASSMQELLDQRPDLAQVEFDFKLDAGRIRVVADRLNDRDRSWLEGKLNANTDLLTSVRQFHDHTVEAYALARKGFGKPLSDAEHAQANASVDRQFNYMSLLKDVADRIRHEYRAQPEFSYRDQSGAPMSFEPDPGSPHGLVDFMNRLRSLQSGPLTVVTASGHTDYVRFNKPFALAGMIIGSYAPKETD